ncbi:MAG: hypothetical protein O7C98_11475 [Planctomycetota bacterium]|nr:hypothetical protein [Planctomycetota bacterium]
MNVRLLGAAVAVLTALTLGCGSDREPEPTNTQDKGAPSSDTTEQDEVTAALAELSPADRKLAMAQKVCPVSGRPLGSMGTPIKVTGGGETVFLCCGGCVKRFENDPEQYLAKMK